MLQQELSLRQRQRDMGGASIQRLSRVTPSQCICTEGPLVPWLMEAATIGCYDHMLHSIAIQPAIGINFAILHIYAACLTLDAHGFCRWLMASYAFIAIVYQGGASCITLAGRTYTNTPASANWASSLLTTSNAVAKGNGHQQFHCLTISLTTQFDHHCCGHVCCPACSSQSLALPSLLQALRSRWQRPGRQRELLYLSALPQSCMLGCVSGWHAWLRSAVMVLCSARFCVHCRGYG